MRQRIWQSSAVLSAVMIFLEGDREYKFEHEGNMAQFSNSCGYSLEGRVYLLRITEPHELGRNSTQNLHWPLTHLKTITGALCKKK
jgi:hypothetical protein